MVAVSWETDTSASNLSDFIVFRLFEEPFDHDEQRILSDRHAFPKSTAECCPAKHMHPAYSPRTVPHLWEQMASKANSLVLSPSNTA